MSLADVLEMIETEYTYNRTAKWTYDYLYIPPLASALYLAIVFGGKQWMTNRRPYNLRTPLVLWNSLLAVFSISGFLILFLPLVSAVYLQGLIHAICNSEIVHNSWLTFWSLLFVLSKIVEFGDTFFIVLRKTPLSFLHWYHHITVLMYSWHGLATKNSLGHWFGAINLGVHAIMYTYYMFKAMGFRISAAVAKAITVLQLAQFFIGLTLLFTVAWLWIQDRPCTVNTTHIQAGVVMYGSYFFLFLNFFYQRYIAGQQTKPKKS